MRFRVNISTDRPGSEPNTLEFEGEFRDKVHAGERASLIWSLLGWGGYSIRLKVQAIGADEGGQRKATFKAIHIPRIVQTIQPAEFITIPKAAGWMTEAECYMTADELAKMDESGITYTLT